MSKEIVTPGPVNVAAAENCLISSITSIAEILAPNHPFNPSLLHQALAKINDQDLINLFALLAKHKVSSISHHAIEVTKKDKLFRTLTAALQGGALCELTVYGKLWLKEVLSKNAALVSRHGRHSIFIYGYYQPKDNQDHGWFYIADPYCEHSVFVDSDVLSRVISSYPGGRIPINLFNLCLDHADLTKKFPARYISLHGSTQRAILRRLPGDNPQTKLRTILQPK